MKAVIMDNIPLDYGPWLTCSPECLDFLKGLLMRDPAQRMTATEALEHPWFRRHFGEPIKRSTQYTFFCSKVQSLCCGPALPLISIFFMWPSQTVQG